MTAPRIGSLFTGTGAFDLAVMDVFGGEVVWHSQYEPPDKNGRPDVHQYAAKILARHWPHVPNLGDITAIKWQQVADECGPIDILTGGFPCQDVSSAGKRAGLTADSRSGLWTHMARAIHVLRPRLVVIENVEGLLSAPAAGDMEPCPHCVGDGSSEPALRALGAVLGDLASLGFDAEWQVLAASAVGAAHQRKRVIIYAQPVDADPADLGHEWDRGAWDGRTGSADGGVTPADADNGRPGEEHSRTDFLVGERPSKWGRAVQLTGADGDRATGIGGAAEEPAAGRGSATTEPVCGGEALADATGSGRQGAGDQLGRAGGRDQASSDAHGGGRDGHQERDGGPEESQPEREPGLDVIRCGVQRTAPADATSSPGRVGNRDAVQPGSGTDQRGTATGGSAPSDADSLRQRAELLELRPGQPDVDWGAFEAAIRRWEAILGRPVPWPTDLRGRLSPVFTEWLMGLPDGWVTATPGLTRNAMLRALGNGVVRRQAAAALRLLAERAAA